MGFCLILIGRIGPQYPLLIVRCDKKRQRSEKLYLEAVWKELIRDGQTYYHNKQIFRIYDLIILIGFLFVLKRYILNSDKENRNMCAMWNAASRAPLQKKGSYQGGLSLGLASYLPPHPTPLLSAQPHLISALPPPDASGCGRCE